DDIAYDAHDIDDGLRAVLFPLDELAPVPLAGDILREIAAAHPGLDPTRCAHELVRRLITRMIEDVLAEGARRLAALGAAAGADGGRRVRRTPSAPAMASADRAIKAFLLPRMYRHPRVMGIMGDAERVVAELFGRYCAEPDNLPEDWRHGLDPADAGARARHIADFIAGMTDRYAQMEHARLFDSPPELR